VVVLVESSLEYAEFALRLLTATLGGALIGIERERMQLGRARARAGSMPGVRSLGLISMYGCLASIAAILVSGGSGLEFSLAFSSLTLSLALFLAIYMYTVVSGGRATGVTTFMVVLVAYMVGVLAGFGRLIEAASISVLATLLLALKNTAVSLAKAISYEELIALMEVAALAIIVGPIVAVYSPLIPWVDIYRVYLFFLLVLTVSLLSYGAARIWGPRGLVYGATLGSIANSEATIASVTRLIGSLPLNATEKVGVVRLFTVLVTSVMQARSATLALASIAIFAGPHEIREAPTLMVLALTSTSIAMISFNRGANLNMPPVAIVSPLSWYSAVKAALTYTLLVTLAKLLEILEAPGIAYVPLVILGGFANATATILGVVSTVSFIGVGYASTLTLLAIASATLNKIVYSDRSTLGHQPYNIIVKTSIATSLIPGTLALIQWILLTFNIIV
jgi:uncharacterized membrane protein (DUF4010 family)